MKHQHQIMMKLIHLNRKVHSKSNNKIMKHKLEIHLLKLIFIQMMMKNNIKKIIQLISNI